MAGIQVSSLEEIPAARGAAGIESSTIAARPSAAVPLAGTALNPALIRQVVELIAADVHADLAAQQERGASTVESNASGAAGGMDSTAAAAPQQMGWRDLYAGSPGTAMFLAAHARATGDSRSRAAALELLDELIDETSERPRPLLLDRSTPPTTTTTTPIGAAVGIGSAIYALLVTGRLLAEPRLLDAAHDLTAALTPAAIRADDHLDVIFGSAGALLVLLALDDERPGANRAGRTPLDLAIECGAHLLRHGATPAAPSSGPRPGFSHGTSGIILALAKLHQRTGKPALWAAVRAGAAAERPHLRQLAESAAQGPSPERAAAASWCHGAAGIALSRCAILEAAAATTADGGAELAEDLERALEIDAAIPQLPLDHLCCGNLGRVDALLRIDPFLPGARLRQRSLTLLLGVLRALKKRRAFALDEPAATLSLFRGLPGIGYALLRWLAEPSRPPCPLLFEGTHRHDGGVDSAGAADSNGVADRENHAPPS